MCSRWFSSMPLFSKNFRKISSRCGFSPATIQVRFEPAAFPDDVRIVGLIFA